MLSGKVYRWKKYKDSPIIEVRMVIHVENGLVYFADGSCCTINTLNGDIKSGVCTEIREVYFNEVSKLRK
ncbi:hypothetical protein PQE75_gp074 [Bacillus phage vB_BcoS-136]|uniref:Uncharacterized protein n=1 Tax=Bacillus phage vB_BcoS-136 TaxID=2419619 RepID=A0A3G3BVW2_9CAUD|nr:hypothetical protein PQE75_gp074 [Bacillus phage vB_BcoS-136]AYP68206.1 hypothetical protein vBBcoS136_00074 [Bacillus phage vB_BcoS-136]